MPRHDDDLARLSQAVIRSGSKSFAAAARLFDARTRASVHLLYAWCRHCDDAIDGQVMGHRVPAHGPAGQRETLTQLRAHTQRALDGEAAPDDPVFLGLQRVVARHAIPHHHVFELLDGFAMDVEGRHYESLDDTLDYAYHVAGVVGVMMSIIMGAREEATLDRAAELGIAFQLTNIARDVVDDANAGRVYLPRRWLHAQGVPQAAVADPRHRPAVFQVVARLLEVADQFYAASGPGIVQLPLRCGWAVETARIVYCQIGREVMKRGPKAWDKRVSTSRGRKLAAIGQGAVSLAMAHTQGTVPARAHTLWTRPGSRHPNEDGRVDFADARNTGSP